MSRLSPGPPSIPIEWDIRDKRDLILKIRLPVTWAGADGEECDSGRDRPWDRGPLPAGLIQTSPAARQLNLLGTSLGGRALRRPFFNRGQFCQRGSFPVLESGHAS